VAADRHGLTTRLAQPSTHSARSAQERHGGVQPGDKVWGNRQGQLAQEKGKVLGKVGTHRGGCGMMGRRSRLVTVVFRWGAAPVIFGVLSSCTGVNGGVRAWLQLERGGADPRLTGEGGATTSGSKPTRRGTVSGA
jgi:hypothetical protein